MNSGDTAWVLASTALVMVMTPGLALFYGGMVRKKNALNMLMMSFICLAVVTVLWAIGGFGLAFGPDLGGLHGPGLVGKPDLFLHHAIGQLYGNTPDKIPMLAFAMFQLMFAVLTVALISGSVAERVKFGGWTLFAAVWALLVYFPVAHWVFAADTFADPGPPPAHGLPLTHGGWLHNAPIHALDFAGGTTVHINAGAAGLALALVVKQRHGWSPSQKPHPHNLSFVLLGASLLWFGWYGFNAGSALSAGNLASIAFTNTTLATAAAVLGWLLVQQVGFDENNKLRFGGRDRLELRPTTLGAASGAVAGLVAITPACAYVAPVGALAIGLIAGVGCALFVDTQWKKKWLPRYGGPIDDALDVVGIHLIGGLIGTLLIGFLATKSVNSAGADGWFYSSGWFDFNQLWRQAVAAGAVMGYSFWMTFGIGKFIHKFFFQPGGLRVDPVAELSDKGIDWEEHQEVAYDDGVSAEI